MGEMVFDLVDVVQVVAAVCGLLGAALLAHKGRHAGWGFVAYLGSNAGWLWFSFWLGHWGLFGQTVGFTGLSLYGVWNWLVRPAPVGPDLARLAELERGLDVAVKALTEYARTGEVWDCECVMAEVLAARHGLPKD